MTTWHPTGKVVVSVAWTTTPSVMTAFEELGPQVQVLRRSSDWGKGRYSRLLLLARSTAGAVRASRDAEKLVILTAGYEVFMAVVLLRLLRAGSRPGLVVADFLIPRSRRLGAFQGWLLRRVDAWVCIRRGDIATLHDMFGVDAYRCTWMPFPLSAPERVGDALETGRDALVTSPAGQPDLAEGYVYSGGTAHRDWPLVLDAVALAGCRAMLAVDPDHPQLSGRPLPAKVSVLGTLSPEDGRRVAAGADVVVVALRDTHLPAGPLVLTDALALGTAVVATDVNGTRDYVLDGITGLLVPPGDPSAMATALRRLLDDAQFRATLGSNGRDWAMEHLQPVDFARSLIAWIFSADPAAR